ncbi:DnaA regulatory inactivator Hda [gamma proteobacterium HTCC5015]|nr:DnaA regulatory inactivator Hda [gamma proteobacterium HTCC5015]
MNTQLLLGIQAPEYARFERYWPGADSNNCLALELCQQAARNEGERQCFLYGDEAVGKTHLLQAACAEAALNGLSASFIPLREMVTYGCGVLQGLEQQQLVCIDDIHVIAGQAGWEEAVFDLINRCREQDTRLLMSSSIPASSHAFELGDLRSRLAWGPVLQLHELQQDEKWQWLQARAEYRGFFISEESGQYLFAHYPRSMAFLNYALEELDRITLQTQRKVTVPLLKQELNAP